MDVYDVLRELDNRDITVEALENGQLLFRPSARLDDGLKAALTEVKDDLLSMLKEGEKRRPFSSTGEAAEIANYTDLWLRLGQPPEMSIWPTLTDDE